MVTNVEFSGLGCWESVIHFGTDWVTVSLPLSSLELFQQALVLVIVTDATQQSITTLLLPLILPLLSLFIAQILTVLNNTTQVQY